MGCIQVALTDRAKAEALRAVLARSAQVEVECVTTPDLSRACVVVVDPAHLRLLPAPLSCPEKVVLISRNDPEALKSAWDAGVSSVVSEQDPLNTAVLAILAACLRTGAARPRVDEPQILG